MTITVSVPYRDKAQDVRKQGIARAQEAAKDFSNLPLQTFALDQSPPR
jgi:hypothetical protein